MRILCFFFFLCLGGQLWGQELKCGYYPDGKLRYKGYFVNGQPTGEMIRYYPEGNKKAEMNYRGDSVDVILYNRQGDYTITGKYFCQKKWGMWRSYKGKQLVAEEEYQNDVLNGKSVRYAEGKTRIEEKYWKAGKPEGIWKLFYANGQLKLQACYVAGELEGEVVSYFPEGQLSAKGRYKHNRKEGEWGFYNPAGEVIRKQVYHQGRAENAEEQELEASRQLDALINSGKKIPDPAVFADDPEAYMKLTGME